MPLPAERSGDEFANDPVAPQAPIDEWTLDDVVKVLDDGRSIHWKALARVARRGENGIGLLLVEALTRTSNRIAVDYLSRVLDQGD